MSHFNDEPVAVANRIDSSQTDSTLPSYNDHPPSYSNNIQSDTSVPPGRLHVLKATPNSNDQLIITLADESPLYYVVAERRLNEDPDISLHRGISSNNPLAANISLDVSQCRIKLLDVEGYSYLKKKSILFKLRYSATCPIDGKKYSWKKDHEASGLKLECDDDNGRVLARYSFAGKEAKNSVERGGFVLLEMVSMKMLDWIIITGVAMVSGKSVKEGSGFGGVYFSLYSLTILNHNY